MVCVFLLTDSLECSPGNSSQICTLSHINGPNWPAGLNSSPHILQHTATQILARSVVPDWNLSHSNAAHTFFQTQSKSVFFCVHNTEKIYAIESSTPFHGNASKMFGIMPTPPCFFLLFFLGAMHSFFTCCYDTLQHRQRFASGGVLPSGLSSIDIWNRNTNQLLVKPQKILWVKTQCTVRIA